MLHQNSLRIVFFCFFWFYCFFCFFWFSRCFFGFIGFLEFFFVFLVFDRFLGGFPILFGFQSSSLKVLVPTDDIDTRDTSKKHRRTNDIAKKF